MNKKKGIYQFFLQVLLNPHFNYLVFKLLTSIHIYKWHQFLNTIFFMHKCIQIQKTRDKSQTDCCGKHPFLINILI